MENCKIKDGDNLYLLTYRWADIDGNVTVMKTGTSIWGVDKAKGAGSAGYTRERHHPI